MKEPGGLFYIISSWHSLNEDIIYCIETFIKRSRKYMNINDYLTIDFLTTMAGMVFTVTLLTQFFKKIIDKVKHIPTEYVVYILTLLLMFTVNFIKGTCSFQNVFMIIINSVLVAMSAMKSYEKIAESAVLKYNKQMLAETEENVNSD